MRQGVRGMEQIKNRCLYTCDSAFQNWAETELSACGAQWFLPLSPPHTSYLYWTYSHFIFPRWRQTPSCVVEIPTSINNSIPFPDSWGDKHVAWADVDTPGNYPATFRPEIMAFQAAWSSGEKFQRHDIKQWNLLVITLRSAVLFVLSNTDSAMCEAYFIYQECSGETKYRSSRLLSESLLTNDAQPRPKQPSPVTCLSERALPHMLPLTGGRAF